MYLKTSSKMRVSNQLQRTSTRWPPEWLASNFSLQYHTWIKHKGHENKLNDHQLKKLLIVRQILKIFSALRSVLCMTSELSFILDKWAQIEATRPYYYLAHGQRWSRRHCSVSTSVGKTADHTRTYTHPSWYIIYFVVCVL